jgi:hypothetical protein
MAWVRAQFCKLQKRVHSPRSRKWKFTSCLPMISGSPVSSTTKSDRHDIAEILLKVVLKHQK